jgi:hypothetical protein
VIIKTKLDNINGQDFLTEIKIFLSLWQDILWQAVWSPDSGSEEPNNN